MVKIHRREIQRRGRQMLAFLLAAAMIIGLIPQNIHVSAASKATEDTYESGEHQEAASAEADSGQ